MIHYLPETDLHLGAPDPRRLSLPLHWTDLMESQGVDWSAARAALPDQAAPRLPDGRRLMRADRAM